MSRETKQGFGLRGRKGAYTFFFSCFSTSENSFGLTALRAKDSPADDGGNSDSDARPTLYTASEKREKEKSILAMMSRRSVIYVWTSEVYLVTRREKTRHRQPIPVPFSCKNVISGIWRGEDDQRS